MSSTKGRTFTMADVVARTGLAPSTVRYYITTGLVPPPHRVAPNRYRYDEGHLESLRLISLLKERRHMPLEAIRKVLPDLLELPADGAFRPAMWDQIVAARARSAAESSPAGRLLEVGIQAFNRHGYADVRVDDVCRAAGMAKGSFYRHFCSKEELFFAAAREVAADAERTFAVAVGERAVGPDRALRLLSEALEPNLALLLDLMALSAQRRPGHGRVLREIFSALWRTVRAKLAAVDADRAEEILERALVSGIRHVVVAPLLDRGYEPTGEADSGLG